MNKPITWHIIHSLSNIANSGATFHMLGVSGVLQTGTA